MNGERFCIESDQMANMMRTIAANVSIATLLASKYGHKAKRLTRKYIRRHSQELTDCSGESKIADDRPIHETYLR